MNKKQNLAHCVKFVKQMDSESYGTSGGIAGGGRTRYMGSDDRKSMNNYDLQFNDEVQRNKLKSYSIPVNLGSSFTYSLIHTLSHF